MMGPVNAQQVELLDKSLANSEHLLSLINDILDISKIESGSLKLFVEDNVNVETEILAVYATGQAILRDKPVEFRTEISPDLPLIVGDKRRIRQILMNLVSNACKFTAAGSVIIRAHLNGTQSIVIAVQDSGPGIAPEDQENIFETFRQSQVGIRQGEGTGLGLTISRRLAEAHGGSLRVESRVGEGATFYVTLPIKSDMLKRTGNQT
jgi:signal transduction histidine kinase